MIKIIVNRKSKAIKILAPIFKKEFIKLGYKTAVVRCSNLNKITCNSGDIYFVFTPHKFADFTRNRKNRKALFIMYQQEQLSKKDKIGKMRIHQLRRYIKNYDYIVDVSNYNSGIYKELGRKIDFIIPTAYHENFKFSSKSAQKNQYECLFFGRYKDKPRRIKILNYLTRFNSFYPKFESIYDQKLKSAIVQSRIVINIHQSNMNFPEWLRIMLGMANKKLVISESISHISPLVANKHIVISNWRAMPKRIQYFLKHQREYKKITKQGYNFIKKKYRMDRFIKEFSRLILHKNDNRQNN